MFNLNHECEDDFYVASRKNMIDCQLRPNGVFKDAIIERFERIPRELFVPKSQLSKVYSDEIIFLKEKRFMLSPLYLAKMIHDSEISMSDNVLDVGCGNGYSSFILSSLCASVTGLEAYSSMIKKAQTLLDQNVHRWNIYKENFCFIHSKLSGSKLDREVRYDLIFLQGLVEEMPQKYLNLLSNHASLICFEKDEYGRMFCMKYKKIGQSISKIPLFSANVPVLLPKSKHIFEF